MFGPFVYISINTRILPNNSSEKYLQGKGTELSDSTNGALPLTLSWSGESVKKGGNPLAPFMEKGLRPWERQTEGSEIKKEYKTYLAMQEKIRCSERRWGRA